MEVSGNLRRVPSSKEETRRAIAALDPEEVCAHLSSQTESDAFRSRRERKPQPLHWRENPASAE